MAEAALKETEVDTPVTPEAEQSKPERGDRLNLRPTTGPKNTQDLIRAAIKEVREKKSPPKKAAAPEIKDEPAKAPEAQSAENRDESGRFVAKDKTDTEPVAQTPATGSPPVPATTEVAAQPDTQASKPTVGAPTSWSQEAKAQWASLPPAIQAAVLKREDEASNGIKKYAEQVRGYQELEQVIAPHAATFQQLGMSPPQALNQLLQWERTIRTNPQQGLAMLAQSYGVNLQPQAQNPNPYGQDQTQTEQPFDQQAFMQLAIQQAQQAAQEAAQRRVEAYFSQMEIDNFFKSKPPEHRERFSRAMGAFMNAGVVSTLEDAYQRATWADPDVRAEREAEREAERLKKANEAAAKAAKDAEEKRKAEEAKRAAEAEAKRKASISPRGSTPSGKATVRKTHRPSIRDSILAAAKAEEDRA